MRTLLHWSPKFSVNVSHAGFVSKGPAHCQASAADSAVIWNLFWQFIPFLLDMQIDKKQLDSAAFCRSRFNPRLFLLLFHVLKIASQRGSAGSAFSLFNSNS